jgi:hypothetical protein
MLKINFLVLAIVLIAISSCMTTKTQVGTFREQQGEEYTYAKAKQIWLFWGLFPVGRASANTPASGNCEVVTRKNLGDVIISTLTAGIVTTYTIKINAKKEVVPTNN